MTAEKSAANSVDIYTAEIPLKKQGIFRRIKEAFLYEPGIHSTNLRWIHKHRYFRGVAYLIICAFTTLVYYGWQPFQIMLFRSGAYKWRCTDEEIRTMERDGYCQDQYGSVQAMFTVGLSSEFIIGVLAGVCLDHLGPLFTAILGNGMLLGGWMCLVYSTQSINVYVPGMVLLAGSVNMIAFPCLELGELFPGHSGLAVSLVVAAQTVGTFVAPVLRAVWDKYPSWNFQTVVWGYLIFVVLPCFILSILCHPVKRFAFQEGHVIKETGSDTELQEDVELGEHATEKEKDESMVANDRELSATKEDVDDLTVEESPREGFCAFLRQLSSIEYILFTTYYVAQLFQFGYYPTTVLQEYGTAVSDFQGYILPAQGIFGALFGLAVDKTGTLVICVVLIVMISGAYVLALIRITGLQYFTSVLYVVSNAYIYTVKYTFVAELFPPTHFGVLIGLMGCIAGALTLLNILVQNANRYVASCIAYIIVGGVALLIILILHIRITKKKKARTMSEKSEDTFDKPEERTTAMY